MRLFRNNLLFEVLTAVVVISVAAVLLLDRLATYQELAEKVHMDATISAFNSALRIQKSVMLIQGREREVATLLNQNPVEWLQRAPSNYLGQFDTLPAHVTPAGHWYFDATRKILVYTPAHRNHFRQAGPAPHTVQLGVAVAAIDRSSVEPGILDVTLQLSHPYQWF